MKIAGFKKQSLIDFPGYISSVVFTLGCNFRCGYCHNPGLVLPSKKGLLIEENKVMEYLEKYNKLLDAVCITGGEPTIHKNLPGFISKIKGLGLKVKLDSNGTNPDMLNSLIENKLVDCIAMDIKHVLVYENYCMITGGCISKKAFSKILASIELIKQANISHEFRTTVIKGVHTKEQIRVLYRQYKPYYKIQNFNGGITLNPASNFEPFPEKEFNKLLYLKG